VPIPHCSKFSSASSGLVLSKESAQLRYLPDESTLLLLLLSRELSLSLKSRAVSCCSQETQALKQRNFWGVPI